MKFRLCLLPIACCLLLHSCSVSKKIAVSADKILLKDSSISTGHIGICIYEPATGKYWYQHNAEKYFIPGSNTKLFTLYAGLKYLGDSLPGIRYRENDGTTIIYPTGDPTFLHPDFKSQRVFDFLRSKKTIGYCTQYFSEHLGKGWAWDDYQEKYMVQRSEFPLYGNLIRIFTTADSFGIIPKTIPLSIPNWYKTYGSHIDYKAYRDWCSNEIYLGVESMQPKKDNYQEIPMGVNSMDVTELLADTLHKAIEFMSNKVEDSIDNNDRRLAKIYSQPSDSLFKPMMHRSDNFFAEQTLLMVSNEKLGYMNDEDIIDTLLNNDLKDIPQRPRWVDGSGLSRYNLSTPKALVYLLNKMKNEFGLERLKVIFATGGEGTIAAYYRQDSGYIYAKTGSMSNINALSGFLVTRKNKLLFFSILVNNFEGSSTPVRQAIEKFLQGIRKTY